MECGFEMARGHVGERRIPGMIDRQQRLAYWTIPTVSRNGVGGTRIIRRSLPSARIMDLGRSRTERRGLRIAFF